MSYILVPARESFVRRLLAVVAPLDHFWLTYRLPFQSAVRVTYPTGVQSPSARPELHHELFHVDQFATWWGPWLIPIALITLPVLFTGRWFVERGAYLADIKAGRQTVESAIAALWHDYGWAWPRPLMRRWFYQRLRSR